MVGRRRWTWSGVVATLLMPMAVASPASSESVTVEPVLAWSHQVSTQAEESYGAVRMVGDEIWVAQTEVRYEGGEYVDDSSRSALARYSRDGQLLGDVLAGGDGPRGRAGLVFDGGDWGAVAAVPLDGATVLVRYAADGEQVWRVRLDGGQRHVTAVAVEGATVVVAGTTTGFQFGSWQVETFDFGTGASRARRVVDGNGSVGAVVVTPDEIVLGGLAMDEMVPGERLGSYDAVLVALDPADLSTLWAHQFGTEFDDFTTSLAVHGQTLYWGGVLGGYDYTAHALKGSLIALALDGTELWRRSTAEVRQLVATSDGVVVGGDTRSHQLGADVPDFGGPDVFLQGWSSDGEPLWTQVLGSTEWDGLSGLAVDGDRVLAAGYTSGTMFGPASEIYDAFLAAYDLIGVPQPEPAAPDGAASPGPSAAGPAAASRRIVVHRGEKRTIAVTMPVEASSARQVRPSCSGRSDGLRLVVRGRPAKPRTDREDARRVRVQIRVKRARLGVHECSVTARPAAAARTRVQLEVVVRRRR